MSNQSNPVFFMHIAKTAGSYLNAAVTAAIGEEKVVPHVERFLGGGEQVRQMLSGGHSFISGHVMLKTWQAIERDVGTTFTKCTILRDPIEHLASHILWLDHYNREDKRREYNALDRAHRRLIDLIGHCDLADVGMLDDLLTDLPPLGVRLLDNCQSRYFLFAGSVGIDSLRPISLARASDVRRAMAEFDVVLLQDDLSRGLERLSKVIGTKIEPLAERVNESRSERRIDTTNPIVRQILGKRTIVDSWLLRTARAEVAPKAQVEAVE